MSNRPTGGYEFSQPPSALAGARVPAPGSAASSRPLYRDPQAPKDSRNLMYDRRVVRGNTYAAPVVPSSMAADMERKARDEEDKARRRLADSRRGVVYTAGRPNTPEPVAGRSHAEIQTETFLEVLSDRPPEFEVGVQTDATIDRPPTPIFVPRPSGVDATTQIEAGELFDFDFEVTPVLEVLVGKTLETALLEVLQEDEMDAIRARQEEYEAVRNAELAEVQRLEAEVKRRADEKARRVAQERARRQAQEDIQRRVAASAMARSYITSLQRGVLAQLDEVGYFYDPLRREVETAVMPAILSAVSERTAARDVVARSLTDELIEAAIARGVGHYRAYLDGIEAERRVVEEAAAAAAAAALAATQAAADAEAAATAAAAAAEAGEGGAVGEGDDAAAPDEGGEDEEGAAAAADDE